MIVETAHWIDWRDERNRSIPDGRVYLGSDCCEYVLPSVENMLEVLLPLLERGQELTLVTPVVTEPGLEKLDRLFEKLIHMAKPLEVVCNDWGVFESVLKFNFCTPVIGRLLSGQSTDPRFALISDMQFQKKYEKELTHQDGSVVQLEYKPPSVDLMRHLKAPAVMNIELLNFLSNLGVHRFEVSNLLQGVEINVPEDWHVTMHLPRVTVALRRCLLRGSQTCCKTCQSDPTRMDLPDFPVPLYLSPCEIFYRNENQTGWDEIPGIDRIVLKEF